MKDLHEEQSEEIEGVIPERPRRRGLHTNRSKGDRRVALGSAFLGPAFIAAVAYVDPGNFATNIASGAQFGYLLLWVILVSNLMAMSSNPCRRSWGSRRARTCPRVCRARFPGR